MHCPELQASRRQRLRLDTALRRKAVKDGGSAFAAWKAFTDERAARRDTISHALASRATVILRSAFHR